MNFKTFNPSDFSFPDTDVWLSVEFRLAYSEAFGIEMLGCGVFEDDSPLLLSIFPVGSGKLKYFPYRHLWSHPSLHKKGGGWSKAGVEAIGIFHRNAVEQAGEGVITASLEEDIRPFIAAKYRTSIRYTILHNLSFSDRYEEQVEKRIRKFYSQGTFAELHTIDQCIPLLETTARAAGYFDEKDWTPLLNFFKTLFRLKLIRLFGWYENSKLLGVQVLLISDETLRTYMYFTGIAPGDDHKHVPTMLMHGCLQWSREAGFEEVDLCGANIQGVSRFKESFGGRLEGYFYLEYQDAGWMDRLKSLLR